MWCAADTDLGFTRDRRSNARKSGKPDIKIIFVSGYAEDAFDKSLPDQKQFNFLAKPFTLKQLVKVVKETMAG